MALRYCQFLLSRRPKRIFNLNYPVAVLVYHLKVAAWERLLYILLLETGDRLFGNQSHPHGEPPNAHCLGQWPNYLVRRVFENFTPNLIMIIISFCIIIIVIIITITLFHILLLENFSGSATYPPD